MVCLTHDLAHELDENLEHSMCPAEVEVEGRETGQIAVLPDGGETLLRPVVPDDAERLRRMFYRLSPTSIYLRFFVPAPSQPHWAERLAVFAIVDYDKRYSVVALVEDETIGVASYDRTDHTNEAEAAIVLEDAWQARGLGRVLLRYLAEKARERGVTAFIGHILGDNRRALRMVAKTFPHVKFSWDSGEYEVCAALDQLDQPEE